MKKLLFILLFFSLKAFSQDTTYSTYTITHDTLVSSHFPEQIIHVRDSVVIISDTSYKVYYNSQNYSVVDGSVSVTIPIFDTIPAHDSVYICSLCATHDTTVIVLTPHVITIRANDQGKAFGSTFTFLHNATQVQLNSGFLHAGDVITTDNAASAGSGSGAAAGSYPITLSAVTILNGATNVTAHYTITYIPGTLTVAAPLTLTIKANNQSKTQGTTFTFLHNGSQVSVVSGGLQPGDVITADNAASSAAGSGAASGTYPITLSSVTIMPGPASNYSITYQPGTFVVNTAAANVQYGAFILNGPQTPLPNRIQQAKNIGPLNIYFRYNYNRGDNTYSVGQIQDAGLLVAMTYNNQSVANVAFFPTGAALTACGVTLDSLLTIRKPQILSIENEEGNASYHKGTVQDYLNELNYLTTIAHSHNVPISNGGTTLGVVYALRKWYQDRGRADSVTWLNNALGLGVNAFTAQQEQWYVDLFAGIAAGNTDYINFHWYEPPRQDTFPATTSGVLPALINYMRIATGKPVITTEAGTRNHSSALLFQMFDEIVNAGTLIVIYYDGVGPLAIQNEAAWRAYLLQ